MTASDNRLGATLPGAAANDDLTDGLVVAAMLAAAGAHHDDVVTDVHRHLARSRSLAGVTGQLGYRVSTADLALLTAALDGLSALWWPGLDAVLGCSRDDVDRLGRSIAAVSSAARTTSGAHGATPAHPVVLWTPDEARVVDLALRASSWFATGLDRAAIRALLSRFAAETVDAATHPAVLAIAPEVGEPTAEHRRGFTRADVTFAALAATVVATILVIVISGSGTPDPPSLALADASSSTATRTPAGPAGSDVVSARGPRHDLGGTTVEPAPPSTPADSASSDGAPAGTAPTLPTATPAPPSTAATTVEPAPPSTSPPARPTATAPPATAASGAARTAALSNTAPSNTAPSNTATSTTPATPTGPPANAPVTVATTVTPTTGVGTPTTVAPASPPPNPLTQLLGCPAGSLPLPLAPIRAGLAVSLLVQLRRPPTAADMATATSVFQTVNGLATSTLPDAACWPVGVSLRQPTVAELRAAGLAVR